MKKIYKPVLFLLLVVQVVAWVACHSFLAGRQASLAKTENKIDLLLAENKELKKEIAVNSSLALIKEKALALGLAEMRRVVILPEADKFAYQR